MRRTPAVGELLIFFGCLFFFLLSRDAYRRFLVGSVVSREQKLTVLRVLNGIEARMTRYVAVVTSVNVAIGVVTALLIYANGLPSPVLWGFAAFLLNFVTYVGAAITTIILFVLGILTLSSLQGAAVAPAIFLGIATLEGHLFTPSLMGRQMTLSPLAMFLSLAFWTWLWGPIGTFLAMPILIAMSVVYHHIVPDDEIDLPG